MSADPGVEAALPLRQQSMITSHGSLTNDEIKHRILNVYAKFVSDVEPDLLCDWLVQELVITPEQSKEIRSENRTSRKRCRSLLDFLFSTQHPRAFLVVRQALIGDNHYLVDSIDNYQEPSNQKVSQDGGEKISVIEQRHEQERKDWNDEREQLMKEIQEQQKLIHSDSNIQKIFALEQKHEEERKAWSEEKEQLEKQIQVQQRLVCQGHNNERSGAIGRSDLPVGIQVITQEDFRQLITQEDFNEGHNNERSGAIGRSDLPVGRQLIKEENFIEQPRYRSNPVLIQTIRTQAAEIGKKAIRGLAILDKELFVVNWDSSEVEVYDSVTFCSSRQWTLEKLIEPVDVVSCNRNKCLYIFDQKARGRSKEILRVGPKGNLIRDWSTEDDYGHGISVTDEANVLLTVYNKNKISEYSPDGELIREINLSSGAGICHPRHAVKLTNGQFMVSHGYEPDKLHRVCLIDADGRLQKSFGGKPGSNVGQVNYPVYLAVDGNGCLMVADRKNQRVLLLDSDLEFIREILCEEKNGLKRVWSILLDESNDRLYVTDNEYDSSMKIFRNGRILVFNFK